MKADGVEANIFTYSALIMVRQGAPAGPRPEIFEECQAAGNEPDGIVLGVVISACEKDAR